jgi:hypothetical protein
MYLHDSNFPSVLKLTSNEALSLCHPSVVLSVLPSLQAYNIYPIVI